ncbi:hypothetical protein [Brevundimonas sp.]|uniref:hypothetical protein n=1 Tax=Brevundimonas sp. TaxID=1871086 RepID=UPI002D248734|nr:hypothetical protein [Brevundimonas sp.]HYC98839.1 hypothetical protein [Brevundimonas sp.]
MTTLFILAVVMGLAAGPDAERLDEFSSDLSDYNLSLDDAGRFAVLARSGADFAQAAIYSAERGAGGWAAPRRMAFSDPAWADSDPWVTPDGRTIYFISTRPAPGREADRQDYDIWRVDRTAAGWSEPEHLGPEVNSRGQELGPELHGETLYFSSARRSGPGGLDIYQAGMKDGGFEPARLIDGPFLTAQSESDFTLSRDGATALFWRLVDGEGLLHIAHRSSAGWSEPAILPPHINIGRFNFTPSFSTDGDEIRFASMPRGEETDGAMADIYSVRLSGPAG